MDIYLAILLGIVQGITEWLPISSSGHLVIIQILSGYRNSILFDIMVHGGTLLAVILFFWRDFLNIIKNFFMSFVDIFKMGFGAFTINDDRKLTWYIVVGTVPIVIVGLAIQNYVEDIFNSLLLVGIAEIFTGLWLFSTRKRDGAENLNLKNTFIVGLAQTVAIIPGISRSGSTISTALLQNVDKIKAAKFSFLLSIPAIGGALTLELIKSPMAQIITMANIIGFIMSFVMGILTIKFLLGVIKRGKFHIFSFYCWILGVLVIFISLI